MGFCREGWDWSERAVKGEPWFRSAKTPGLKHLGNQVGANLVYVGAQLTLASRYQEKIEYQQTQAEYAGQGHAGLSKTPNLCTGRRHYDNFAVATGQCMTWFPRMKSPISRRWSAV